ncbi:hypothetical protein F5884DRAFT_754725 [Xylogone sp. PMI_703]|nr:hypothetical protein F5884DRAFT_754725 [Xylogone sp. PMI_703]
MPFQAHRPICERILGSEDETVNEEVEKSARTFGTSSHSITLITANYERLARMKVASPPEFSPLHSSIDLVEVQFSGTLAYTEADHLYMDIGEDGVRHFGEPSPEIDQAWRDLPGKRDALPRGSKYQDYPGRVGYVRAEDILVTLAKTASRPDLFHTLHCINEVRKIPDGEYLRISPLWPLTVTPNTSIQRA